MKAAEKFWVHIGERLAEKHGVHPKAWKPKFAKQFLENKLQETLRTAYSKNTKVKALLDVSSNVIPTLIPSYDTFRRIFKTAESTSSMVVRNLFAIYLDEIGYIDYLEKYEIKADIIPQNSDVDKKKEVSNKTTSYINYGSNPTFINDAHKAVNIYLNQDDSYKIINKNQNFAIISEEGWNFRVRNNQGKLNLIEKEQIPQILTVLPKLRLDTLISRDFSKLENTLHQTNQIIAVQGEAGIGKTTFVQNFLERNRSKFNHIAWIDVKNTVINAIAEQYALADSLLISPNVENKTDRFLQITNILRQLSGKNLLILDNVKQDVEHTNIYDNIRLSDNWAIIVTTEEEELEDFISIPLEPLSKLQLIGLFETHYNKPCEYGDIDRIIHLLKFNTRDIIFIAKRARALRLKLPEVITRITQNGLDSFQPSI